VSVLALLRRRSVLALLAVAVLAGAVGLALFQPWKLVVDETVNEAAPPGLELATPPPASPAASAGSPDPVEPVRETTAPEAPRPVLLASGTLISHEHRSSGSVRVIGLADGRRLLRLDDLDTSNGPDLHVWITDAPVLPGRDGWYVFDDGAHVDLGSLKGNRGSQNYELPASVDLAKMTSVTVWCDRFNVSFAAAALQRS
jgi:hypothetical protein